MLAQPNLQCLLVTISKLYREKKCTKIQKSFEDIANIYFTIVKLYFWLKYIFHLSFYY